MHDVNDFSSGSRRTRVWGVKIHRPIGFTGRMIFGLIVLALGVLWTLDNLNILESEPILRWWPALIVAFGLAKLTGIGARPQPVAGAVFAIVGTLMLGNELDVLHIRLWTLWPLVLIVLGTSLVVRSMRGPAVAPAAGATDLQSEIHSFTMMGGLGVKNESQEFRGGDVSAVMGGVEVDLRKAKAAAPQVTLDVFAWWGGIDVFVPRDWRVVSEVLPIMAGYEDQSAAPEGTAATTTLIIRGLVVMGGIEIKN